MPHSANVYWNNSWRYDGYHNNIIMKFNTIHWCWINSLAGDTTPTSNSNLPFDLHLILAPIIFTLLFLILLALGIGITFLCVRAVLSSQRKNARREQEKIVNVTLDTLERRSVNNIYPPLGKEKFNSCLPQMTGPFLAFDASIAITLKSWELG